MQKLENGVEVPTNSDPYNLTADLAKMGNTTNTLVPVNSQGARDGLTKKAGLAVARLDKAGAPIEIWDGGKWCMQPVIEIGQGNNAPIFKSLEVAVTLNDFLVGVIPFATPFPNAVVSVDLMRRHTTSGPVTFTILSTNTDKGRVQFVASGATAGQIIYVTYQAWGY